MEPKNALLEAQQMLAIEDVYVQQAEARAGQAYEPLTPPASFVVQLRVTPRQQVHSIQYEADGQPRVSIRYTVDTGLRLLMPDTDASKEEIPLEKIVAEISAAFVVRYNLIDPTSKVSEEQLLAFSENALFHMWPYWREFLQATASRLRLPAIILPMKAPRQNPAGTTQQ